MFPTRVSRSLALAAWALALAWAVPARAADPFLVFPGGQGPGAGKHVVLVAGDEEYRSEEALPQLGRILSDRHGFKCTVLFPVDKSGVIDPNVQTNIPGLDALKTADLLILFTRFRNLPEDQIGAIAEYIDAGKPVIGMRTATHAFAMKTGHPFAGFSWDNKAWEGGFGRQILGETWVSHHGDHGKESTRGLIAPGAEGSPILRGIKSGDIWGPTDVYTVRLPLSGDGQALILGQVLAGMKVDSPPVAGKKNEPMLPVAWTRTYTSKAGKTGKAFTTTMGAATDLASEGLRRLLVNATYWAVGLADQIPDRTDVTLVGDYKPTPFGFNGAMKGRRPEDYETGVFLTKPHDSVKPIKTSLFDGKTLDGWVQQGGKAVYKVEDGVIVGTTVPKTGNSFLCTTRDYADFDLELDFLVDDALNSGVQIRSHCLNKPSTVDHDGKVIKIPAGRVHGYQVEIDPAARAWTGGIYDESRRAWLNDLKANEAARQAFKHKAWNHFRIECRGPSIKTWLNGVPAADLRDTMDASGFIALQVHGVGDKTDPLQVRWRQIEITTRD